MQHPLIREDIAALPQKLSKEFYRRFFCLQEGIACLLLF